MTRDDHRALLEATYRAALVANDPARLVRAHAASLEPPDLIVALGKASPAMLGAALEGFPGTPFLLVSSRGTAIPVSLRSLEPNGGEILTAAHPIPDETSQRAATRALERVGALSGGQHALTLVSGGGSALLCAPWGVTLAEKRALTLDLLRSGASVQEINTVRKHLSGVKGGRLVEVAVRRGARVTSLLLSDVVGDDPGSIASGPTVPDATTYADAIHVLEGYGLRHDAARQHLERGAAGELPETPKPGAADFERQLETRVIGSNRLLLEAAAAFLETQGWRARILGDAFTGEARDLAAHHARIVLETRQRNERVALLSGGETTVTVRGSGTGGRNHEFALALLLELAPKSLWGLSAGSDGVDGTTPAAGAFLEPHSLERAAALGLNARASLECNDSGGFFARLEDQLHTGPTGNNLNDLRILLVEDRESERQTHPST